MGAVADLEVWLQIKSQALSKLFMPAAMLPRFLTETLAKDEGEKLRTGLVYPLHHNCLAAPAWGQLHWTVFQARKVSELRRPR